MTTQQFDGRSVEMTGIRLAKAGMGLSDALSVKDDFDPHIGDVMMLLIEVEVSKVQFERIMAEGEDTGLARRVVTLDVLRAAPMEGRAADKALRDTEKAVESRRGVQRLVQIDEDADRETFGDDGDEGE